MVIIDPDAYLKEGYTKLSNRQFHTNLETDPTDEHAKEINTFIDSMLSTCKGEIDHTVYNYLYNKDCRTSVFYLLPKVHKGVNPTPGHPILSANGCPSEKISQFMDHFLSKKAPRELGGLFLLTLPHKTQVL